MQRIPIPVLEIIQKWIHEFHRVDAMERVAAFRSNFNDVMKCICEDVRMNTPIYKFTIQTQSHHVLYINICLPNCDPHHVHPLPESHIDGYVRRSISVCQ
jgi:hypothetical protein